MNSTKLYPNHIDCTVRLTSFEQLLQYNQTLLEKGELDDTNEDEILEAIDTHINDNLNPYTNVMIRINHHMYTTFSTEVQDVHASLGGLMYWSTFKHTIEPFLNTNGTYFYVIFHPRTLYCYASRLPHDVGVGSNTLDDRDIASFDTVHIQNEIRYIMYGYHLQHVKVHAASRTLEIPQDQTYIFAIRESYFLPDELYSIENENPLVAFLIEDSIACRRTLYNHVCTELEKNHFKTTI